MAAAPARSVFKNKKGEVFGVALGHVFQAPASAGLDPARPVTQRDLDRDDVKTLMRGEIKEVRIHEDKDKEVEIATSSESLPLYIDTFDASTQKAFGEAVARMFPNARKTTSNSIITNIPGPLILGAIMAIPAGLLIVTAEEMDAGKHHDTHRVGKAGLIMRLVELTASSLGKNGSYALVFILGGVIAAWIFQVILTAHRVTRYKV